MESSETIQGRDISSVPASTPLFFNTHKYFKRFKAAGFTEQQAEAQTEVFTEILEERLATKQDIEGVKLQIEGVKQQVEANRLEAQRDTEGVKQDIEALRLNLENKILESRNQTIPWVAGLLMAQGAVIAALVRLQ